MPTRNETNRGTWGWLGLAAGVLAFDVLSEETMSHAFSRYPRAAKIASMALVSGHLLDLIPQKYDPLDTLIRYAGARRFAEQAIEERLANDVVHIREA